MQFFRHSAIGITGSRHYRPGSRHVSQSKRQKAARESSLEQKSAFVLPAPLHRPDLEVEPGPDNKGVSWWVPVAARCTRPPLAAPAVPSCATPPAVPLGLPGA